LYYFSIVSNSASCYIDTPKLESDFEASDEKEIMIPLLFNSNGYSIREDYAGIS